MSLNACELEIDLFCLGARIGEDVEFAGARGITRTRAGLGSGLEVRIPAPGWLKPRIWTNVPVEEPFARRSPYVLHGTPSTGHHVVDERSTSRYPVEIAPEPAWYHQHTSRNIAMNRIGVLQGTYLGIYLNSVCAFWNYEPSLNCRFCTTGRNVGGDHEEQEKTISDVVETCWAAKRESGVTFVHFNGGFQGARGIERALPYIKAVKADVGLLVGVQLAPERDFRHYDQLLDGGVDHLSFCVEFNNPEWFARICPGKDKLLGQDLFFKAMAYCASRMPRGAVSGEIIAGVEPIEDTLAAIDRITELGAFPTVCIFRPTIGLDMQDWAAPDPVDMRRVMAHLYDACRRHWLPIGAAPNIEVSIVVNPDDAALLAPRTAGFYVYEGFRKLVRVAARPLFAWKQRARARRVSGVTGGLPPTGPPMEKSEGAISS